jgi:hypothetical protein
MAMPCGVRAVAVVLEVDAALAPVPACHDDNRIVSAAKSGSHLPDTGGHSQAQLGMYRHVREVHARSQVRLNFHGKEKVYGSIP